MAAQEQHNAPQRAEETEAPDAAAPAPAAPSGQSQAATAGLDDLLDEIDGVLESNAEEFVRGFIQKGGQ
ncbi:ubiquitin-like protein Pup [Arthrobacter sp. 35W]|uniref:ubiquitin-like protein Pup n=1 Tax=Arthrobacter sp. 35W TaxID=1132441 RepID=UPI000426BA44|nr:ubiquitin-like protein Pup [Arthrobacter sp. 35W]